MATTRLLTAIHAGAAELHYHGDFDRPGRQIGDDVFRVGARPWRFAATDSAAAPSTAHPQLPAPGGPARCWRPDGTATSSRR